MKTKGRLSLTVILLVLLLGTVIVLEGVHDLISGADVGNITLTLESVPSLAVDLVSPEAGASFPAGSVMFEYSLRGTSILANCSLLLNSAAIQTNASALSVNSILNFTRLMTAGGYTWGVSCTNMTGASFSSITRQLIITGAAEEVPRLKSGNQPPNPVTEIINTIAEGDIKANEIKIITGFAAGSGIESISIVLKRFVSDVKLIVKTLFDKPSAIVEPPEGYVYKYVNIDIPKITSDVLLSAEITFKIEKGWMKDRGISQNSIRLARFSEGSWQKLETKFGKEDADFAYYSAQTSGFGTFAMTAELPSTIAPAAVTEQSTKKITGTPKTPTLFFHLPRAGQFRLPSQSTATIMFITIIAILTIASVAVVAKSFEEKEIQMLSDYITKARDTGNEIKAVEGVLLRYGWHPDTIKKAVWHHRLKRIFHREKKR